VDLARIAGLTRAVNMIMLGRRISALEAHDWGLITRVADDTAVLERMVDDLINTLTNLSPLALTTVKRVLNTSYDASLNVGFEVEGHAYEKLRESGDYKEGIAAFAERRKANFTGA